MERGRTDFVGLTYGVREPVRSVYREGCVANIMKNIHPEKQSEHHGHLNVMMNEQHHLTFFELNFKFCIGFSIENRIEL